MFGAPKSPTWRWGAGGSTIHSHRIICATHTYRHINKCRGTPNDAQVGYNKLVRRAKHVKFFSCVLDTHFLLVARVRAAADGCYCFVLFLFILICTNPFCILSFNCVTGNIAIDVSMCVRSHAENEENTGFPTLVSIYIH